MRKGFTLIEIIIVIAISAMLATIAIIYSQNSQNQVTLSVETSKIAETILQAKNLSIATYYTSTSTCGYGAWINVASNTYSIFAFDPDPANYGGAGSIPPCPGTAAVTAAGIMVADGSGPGAEVAQYSPGTWETQVTNGVHLVSGGLGDDLSLVLFYPPDPTTLVSTSTADPHPLGSGSATVYLETADKKTTATISVNSAGQVSF